MKNSKAQKTVQETLSSIDGIMTALNAYPSLEDALLEKGQELIAKHLGRFFPTQFDFAKLLLSRLGSAPETFIEILGYILTAGLIPIEIALKAALLANMQNLVSGCAIDPIITAKSIKEGIIFDLQQIDLMDKLSVSPLDKKMGKYYYFGIENCESSYDVLMSAIDPNNQTDKSKKNAIDKKQSIKTDSKISSRIGHDNISHYFKGRKRDFDCLLWYMKNKAAYREVWGKRTSLSEDIFYGSNDVLGWLKKKGDKKTKYYEFNDSGSTYSFYQYNGGWEKTDVEFKPSLMNEKTTYYFKEGNNYYKYEYKSIQKYQKINRNYVYYNVVSKDEVYYYDFDTKEKAWFRDEKTLASANHYDSLNDIPLDIAKDKGLYIWLDNKLVWIEKGGIVTKKKKDKDGNEIEYVASLKQQKCVDVSNELKENTCILVDYDLQLDSDGTTNADLINDDIVAESSLEPETNVGQYKWQKTKIKKEDYDTVTTTTNSKQETNEQPKSIKVSLYELCYVKKSPADDTEFDASKDKILIPPYTIKGSRIISTNNDTSNITTNKTYKCVNIAKFYKDKKYTRDFGILTLDFSASSGNVTQSDGTPMQQQTPYGNVLHVFFGNTKELHTARRDEIQNALRTGSESNKVGVWAYKKLDELRKKHVSLFNKKQKEWKKDENTSHAEEQNNFNYANMVYEALLTKNSSTDIAFSDGSKTYKYSCHLSPQSNVYQSQDSIEGVLNTCYKKLNEYNPITNNEFSFDTFKKLLSELNGQLNGYTLPAYMERMSQMMESGENALYACAKNLKYPEAKKNYYWLRTIFEFNYDYVTTLQLFDGKVLAAQILSMVFGNATIMGTLGATATWKTQYIHDVVKDMVEKIIAAEDVTVSDCFYTFSNDAYNGMLRAAELRQAGLYSSHGEENGGNTLDPVALMDGLNGIDDAADQAGATEIIKGAITSASGEVAKDVYTEDTGLEINKQIGIEHNFVESLVVNLATQLMLTMLSPKVYLLILINLELFGLTTDFDLQAFIERFKGLILNLVKAVVAQVMEILMKFIMDKLEWILQKMVVTVHFEQVELYARLLKQMWTHLKQLLNRLNGGTNGWTQDYVTSADIESVEDTTEPVNEC